MKIAYIAHPISGDVEGNIKKIIVIVRLINLTEENVVPFVPYLADLYALNDNDPKERARGIKNDIVILKSGIVDELRLYGSKISEGMANEIELAHKLNIPVVPMTEATKALYEEGEFSYTRKE